MIEEIRVKSSQSIGCYEHDHFLVGGMARARMRCTRGYSGTMAGFSTVSVSAQMVTQHSKDTRVESTMVRCAVSSLGPSPTRCD